MNPRFDTFTAFDKDGRFVARFHMHNTWIFKNRDLVLAFESAFDAIRHYYLLAKSFKAKGCDVVCGEEADNPDDFPFFPFAKYERVFPEVKGV